MKTLRTAPAPHVAEHEWMTFPGGELQGQRPKALCPACRDARLRSSADLQVCPGGDAIPRTPDLQVRPGGEANSRSADLQVRSVARPLCFQCYRAELDRERALRAAGQLDTASEARFQCTLPFEPVNRARLARLRTERAAVRAADQAGVGRYIDKRRHAQIAARHALQRIAEGVRAHAGADRAGAHDAQSARAPLASAEWDAIHAAELQLPEAWLPFVVSR
jgi:hypothetical protein